MRHKVFKRIRRCKTAFAILMALDVIVILIFAMVRFRDNFWPKQEIWVDETNETIVTSQVGEWNLPTDGITRVVMIPGLGDRLFEVYYKDESMKITEVLRYGDVSNEMDQLVREHGEIEGSRAASKIQLILGVVFFMVILGEVITFKVEESVENKMFNQ